VNAPARHEKPISGARVAREMLGRSPAWFTQHRPELEKAGFPKPLPVLHSYLPSQVTAWLVSQGAAAPKSDGFDLGLERLLSGKRGRSAA
jgi:hypothetical protein